MDIYYQKYITHKKKKNSMVPRVRLTALLEQQARCVRFQSTSVPHDPNKTLETHLEQQKNIHSIPVRLPTSFSGLSFVKVHVKSSIKYSAAQRSKYPHLQTAEEEKRAFWKYTVTLKPPIPLESNPLP